MNMQINLNLFPYLEPLLSVHQNNNQQPDNLCGPYWIALLLNAYGGLNVTAVDVAIAASTILPSHGNPSDWIPPNASSLQGTNYNQIPTHPNLDICGTSITGLIHRHQNPKQQPIQPNPPTNTQLANRTINNLKPLQNPPHLASHSPTQPPYQLPLGHTPLTPHPHLPPTIKTNIPTSHRLERRPLQSTHRNSPTKHQHPLHPTRHLPPIRLARTTLPTTRSPKPLTPSPPTKHPRRSSTVCKDRAPP